METKATGVVRDDGYRHFVVTDRPVFTPEKCRKLIDIFRASGHEDYHVQPDEVPFGDGVHQHVLPLNGPEWVRLRQHLVSIYEAANEAFWGFDLDDAYTPPAHTMLVRYLPGFGHDWHIDYSDQDPTKMTMSIALNDRSEWEGGEFKMLNTADVVVPMGHAVIFPSYHGHKINKITKGERYVLLTAISGPPFR